MAADRGQGDFGTKLREARERRGVSLRQIANATKISVTVLEALERNDISRLPGGIFSRAFVRSYAAEVGLDPEATIQDFIAQFPHDSVTAGHPTSQQHEDNEAIEHERRLAGTLVQLVGATVVIASVVLYFVFSGRHAPRSPEPAAAAASPAATSTPALPAESLPPPSERPAPAPPRGAGSAAPVTLPRPPAAAPTAAAAGDHPDDRLTIRLSVVRPCWVSATVDGAKAFERLLNPGEARTIEVRREMVLVAGDAAAIAMTVNGADARPLGKAGEVVTARVNLNNFKDYLQNR